MNGGAEAAKIGRFKKITQGHIFAIIFRLGGSLKQKVQIKKTYKLENLAKIH